jgi:fatty-acyl-CoA synthase
MGNRPEWVAATWGTVISGGVAVLLNTFAQRPELDYLLRHSDAAVLLTEAAVLRHRFVDDVLELCPQARTSAPGRIRSPAYPFLRHIVAVDAAPTGAVQSWEAFLRGGEAEPEAVVQGMFRETVPSEDAIVIYSSGSTSLPKGVLHRQRSPLIQCWRHAYREQLTPEDRVYCTLPLFWTAGFAAVLGSTLGSGACLVMTSSFDAAHVHRLIEQERITIVPGLPNHAAEIRACQERTPRDLSSVRRDAYRLMAGVPSDGRPRPTSHASYGSSETFTSITALPHDATPEECATYGRLTAASSIRILDRETGGLLGVGEEGEILLKGLTLMRGYVKVAPEEILDDDGYLHTGDLGWFDEHGLLHFTGRIANMIKTGGTNVSPLEVEEALLEHPAVHRAVVVGVPDPTAGERVVGCVVPRDGAVPTEKEIREHLRGSLSSYKIPRRILFFAEHDLPRTGSDKFDLPAVRRLAAELLASGR